MIPRVSKQIAEFVDFPDGTFATGDVMIRMANPLDMATLREMSPADVKNPVEFLTMPTLVADEGGQVVGYTQFYITVDGVLVSRAIRIAAHMKGRGIGQMLLEVKEALAIKAGARSHLYPVDAKGEQSLKHILNKMGFHLCQTQAGTEFWLKQFLNGGV